MVIQSKICMPKISILIPVYNREKLVEACIISALRQNYSNFEVIIVDNDSSDSTFDACKKYEKMYENVKVFRNDLNVGPVNNWLECARRASGEYCKILFSDDLLEPDCLSKMVKFCTKDTGLVYCSASIGTNPETGKVFYSGGGSRGIRFEKFMDMMSVSLAPVSPGACLMRTADFLQFLGEGVTVRGRHAFNDHGAGPDALVMLRAAMKYSSVFFIDEPLVFFRAHPGSFTIGDKGGEVRLAYMAAIGGFLRTYGGRKSWLYFVARTWALEIWKYKKYISIKDVAYSCEGSGGAGEQMLVCAFSVYVFFHILRGRIARVLG